METMGLTVSMTGEMYTAEVTPTPALSVAWVSPGPMNGADLIQKLLEIGYHQQDVVDAFAEADPNFISKLNRGDFD